MPRLGIYLLEGNATSIHERNCWLLVEAYTLGTIGSGGEQMSYLGSDEPLIPEIPPHSSYQLELLVDGEASDGKFHDVPERGFVYGDECMIVDVGEKAHDELAIHAVGHATVSRDRVAKILDLESSLEAGGEEPPKGRDQGGKAGPEKDVDLDGCHGDAEGRAGREEEELGRHIGLRDEGGVGFAVQPREDVGTKVVDGADEVLGLHHEVGQEDAEDDRHDPCAHEALNRLLRRQLDELGAAEGDAADVGEDVVGDDEGGREEEPYHAFEYVVHDEMRLHHDEEQGHVRPAELGKLELEVTGLERADKEDEAWRRKISKLGLFYLAGILKIHGQGGREKERELKERERVETQECPSGSAEDDDTNRIHRERS